MQARENCCLMCIWRWVMTRKRRTSAFLPLPPTPLPCPLSPAPFHWGLAEKTWTLEVIQPGCSVLGTIPTLLKVTLPQLPAQPFSEDCTSGMVWLSVKSVHWAMFWLCNGLVAPLAHSPRELIELKAWAKVPMLWVFLSYFLFLFSTSTLVLQLFLLLLLLQMMPQPGQNPSLFSVLRLSQMCINEVVFSTMEGHFLSSPVASDAPGPSLSFSAHWASFITRRF